MFPEYLNSGYYHVRRKSEKGSREQGGEGKTRGAQKGKKGSVNWKDVLWIDSPWICRAVTLEFFNGNWKYYWKTWWRSLMLSTESTERDGTQPIILSGGLPREFPSIITPIDDPHTTFSVFFFSLFSETIRFQPLILFPLLSRSIYCSSTHQISPNKLEVKLWLVY